MPLTASSRLTAILLSIRQRLGKLTDSFTAAAKLAYGPFKKANIGNYSDDNLTAAVTALETAAKALDTASTTPASGSATVTPAPIEDACKASGDINYQNFDLYAYWAYEKAMKAGNAIIDAYKGPVAPEKYIDQAAPHFQRLKLLLLPTRQTLHIKVLS